ncbi:MAG: DUF4278 domain-containing protein [Cyanobacteria bacterium P01_G01_bin.39]
MKLHFLDQAYSGKQNQVETIAAERTDHFLGQNYIPRRPLSLAIKPTSDTLKYRGAGY